MRARTERNMPELNGRLLITTDELAAMLTCGRAKATEVGKNANAERKIGRSVRWHLPTIKEYVFSTLEM